jgi:hypothetical protein
MLVSITALFIFSESQSVAPFEEGEYHEPLAVRLVASPFRQEQTVDAIWQFGRSQQILPFPELPAIAS